MNLKKIALGLVAGTMVTAPVVAQGVITPRVAPLTGDEAGVEGSTSVVIGLLAAAAVVGGIILVADNDGREVPVSN